VVGGLRLAGGGRYSQPKPEVGEFEFETGAFSQPKPEAVMEVRAAGAWLNDAASAAKAITTRAAATVARTKFAGVAIRLVVFIIASESGFRIVLSIPFVASAHGPGQQFPLAAK
jgi:hypothetical protein